jgi:ribosomal protein S18 acetylase RimI-like enzyme
MGMNSYVIKKASPADVPEIKKLLVYVWSFAFPSILSSDTIKKVTSVCFDEELLASQVHDKAVAFLVAKDETAKIVGVANARADEDKVIVLNRIYVNPAVHESGIGKRLLDEIIEYFKGAEKIQLEVVENNVASIAFYRNYGFQITGANINHIDDVLLPVKVMEKIVSSR